MPPNHIRLFEGVERRRAPRLVSNVSSLPARATDISTSPAAHALQLTENESARFMQIVQEASQIGSHYALLQLLQGKIQYFIPHQILISAWGDFRAPCLTLDVVSPLENLRTESFAHCGFDAAIPDCFERYITAGRRPLQLATAEIPFFSHAGADCPIRGAMQAMQSVQIFGVRNERDNQETLYIALNTSAPVEVAPAAAPAREYHAFLIDSVVAQIDVAFRKVAALKLVAAANEPSMRIPANLSSREIDVLTWLTQGKTNVEIAELLNISAHTVKNHAQRIFKKLKVTNRTEVAAMLGIPAPGARSSPAK